MKSFKIARMMAGPLALGLALGIAGVAQAQPGGGAPMGQNPPNWQQGGNRPTPEQMQQFQAQRTERVIRQGLPALGFTDATLQDALIEFVNTQAAATGPLQQKQLAILQALANKETTDEQITTLMTEWTALSTVEKTRREQALKDLDTSISYSKSPRLSALLTIFGVLGDESSLSSPFGGAMMGGGRGGMMGMGGPGGGRGGRRGGGGGNGGGNGGGGGNNGQ